MYLGTRFFHKVGGCMNRAQRNFVMSQCSVIVLMTAIICILVWKYTYRYISINNVICEIDAQLSATAQDELRQYCTENMLTNSYSYDQIIQKIKQHYPYVQQCVCRYTIPQCMHLTVNAHQPYICFNGTTLMTKTGNLLPVTQYSTAAYQNLPHMTIAAHHLAGPFLSSAICNVITEIPSTILEYFSITWESEHVLWLKDRQYPQFSILCDTNGISDVTLCSLAEKIYSLQHDSTQRKKKKCQIIDCRFVDQIIVYDDIRGLGHGKSIG
jgi:hypothetical protein